MKRVQPKHTMFNKITIIGVGLIGGSIGMAAKKNRLAKEIIGVGRREISIRKAISSKAIDKGTLDLKRGVSNADLIIIATPVDKVMEKIREAFRYAKKGAIIIDVNSAKYTVVTYADKIAPKERYFVGTHPLAGLEESGVANATAGLFADTVCIITPTRRTNLKALAKIKLFWMELGAAVKILRPDDHDRVVAKISHLPHIIAYNLCNTASLEELRVAGTGFKDTTRIAKSDPRMWLNIFLQNSRHTLSSIKQFEDNLSSLKSYLRKNSKGPLFRKLYTAQQKRKSIG